MSGSRRGRWGLWVLLAALAAQAAGSLDPADRDYVSPPLPHARLFFQDAFGGERAVAVEVAQTPAARERGLMWRTALAEGQGMLFIFPFAEEHSFWMRNTLIPLDMLFLDDQWQIVGVLESVPPQNLASRSVGKPSRYVLEVPAGWWARAGVRPRSKVRTEGL